MRKILTLTAALTLIAALGSVALNPTGAEAGNRTTIKLDDNFFNPSSKTVKKGTLVRFKWVGRKKHDVTKASGPGNFFQSKLTKKRGVNFKKRFRKKGNYLLVCSIHSGMELNLRVKR